MGISRVSLSLGAFPSHAVQWPSTSRSFLVTRAIEIRTSPSGAVNTAPCALTWADHFAGSSVLKEPSVGPVEFSGPLSGAGAGGRDAGVAHPRSRAIARRVR